MKNTNKKAALREKLKSNFEWTAEAIEDVCANGLFSPKLSSPQAVSASHVVVPDFVTKNESKEDTMEEKIERVQIRKQEAEKRAVKKTQKLSHNTRTNRALREYQMEYQNNNQNNQNNSQNNNQNNSQNNSQNNNLSPMRTEDIAKKLNSYFKEFLKDKSPLPDGTFRGGTGFLCHVPLHFFDVSTFDEVLRQPECLQNIPASGSFPGTFSEESSLNAVCLLSPSQLMQINEKNIVNIGSVNEHSDSDCEERNICLGKWVSCEVIGKEEKKNMNMSMKELGKYITEGKSPSSFFIQENSSLLVRITVGGDNNEVEKEAVNGVPKGSDMKGETNVPKEDGKNVPNDLESIVITVKPMQVYFIGQNLELYGDRVTDALILRRKCVSLIKYHLYVQNIPYDNVIASSLSRGQMDRIRAKCMRSVKSFTINV
jgi:hypothetical protein